MSQLDPTPLHPHDEPRVQEPPRFFDPSGLHDIQRSLSRLSQSLRHEPSNHTLARQTSHLTHVDDDAKHQGGVHDQVGNEKLKDHGADDTEFGEDELTLTDVHVGDGPFDFEKFLSGSYVSTSQQPLIRNCAQ